MDNEINKISNITDNDLNTGQDLITEHLNFELLALKDNVDLRKFSRNFIKIDDVLTPATKDEIESILNQNLIKDVLELATEQDIRNLFVGTILEGGATYNLSSLSTDESRVVNMRLLSLFNDLLLQKISDKDNALDKNLRDYINSVKTSLQANINLKEDKTKVTELINSLRTELTNSINTKADKTILVNVGAGLKGGGNLSSNISINMDYGTSQEIEELLNQNLLKEVFELATEQDIRNLFAGTRLEGGTEYKLSALSTDESKIVNMRLLSLYNDLISQKFSGQTTELNNAIENLKKIQIIAGNGLLGSGTLIGNITFSLDYGTTEEVQSILK